MNRRFVQIVRISTVYMICRFACGMPVCDSAQTTPGASLVPGVVIMIDDSYTKKTSGEPFSVESGGNRMGRDGQNAAGDSGATGSNGDLFSCLPASYAQVLRKLRAPALTIRYSMEKQFIPNLDAVRGSNVGLCGNKSDGKQPGSPQNHSQGSSGESLQSVQHAPTRSDAQKNCSASQPGSMCEQGNLTVRLFDAAICCTVMLTLICLTKCCCGMKRMCRHWL